MLYYYGEKKHRKSSILKELHRIEVQLETEPLSDEDYLLWTTLKAQLDNIYLEE
jgi:hypothetical protein